MKNKTFLFWLSALIMLLTVRIFSQSAPHDSLLFDGHRSNLFFNGSCVCTVKVKKCDGEAHGSRMKREIMVLCGQKETTYTVIKSILTEGDEVLVGDDYPIYTEEGTLKLQLENGVIIHLAEKTKVRLGADYCCSKGVEYTLIGGTICFENKSPKGTEVTCKTRNNIFRDIMTLYTVESNDEADILKVYEGKVKASIQHPDKTESDEIGEKMRQLAKDVQEGKISVDEFQKKAKEYSDRIKYLNEHSLPLEVEAGNKCTVTKSTLTVEPIESNDVRWWEK